MPGQQRRSSAQGFTGAADPPRAVLACAQLHRAGQPLPRHLAAQAQQAIAPAFGLSERHTLRVEHLTASAWSVMEGWARRRT